MPIEASISEGVSLLRLPAVLARTGLSRSAVYLAIQRGEFPKPMHIAGTRASLWDSRAIDLWVADVLKGAA
ncbi:MAG: AlpA family phage regulatory protein [Devosia sp.]